MAWGQLKSTLRETFIEVYSSVGISCGKEGPAWWNAELRKEVEEKRVWKKVSRSENSDEWMAV